MEQKHQSARKLRVKGANYCCVPQCSQYAAPNISFHYFPKDTALKKIWEAKLKMGKPASSAMKVCSNHFLASDYFPSSVQRKKLFPKSVPTQNLPKTLHDRVETSPKKRLKEGRRNRAEAREKSVKRNNHEAEVNVGPDQEIQNTAEGGDDNRKIKFSASVQASLADFRTTRTTANNEDTPSLASILSDNVTNEKCTQVNLLPEWTDDKCDSSKCQPDVSFSELLSSKEKLFTFTGVHSLDLLQCLVECAEELALDAPTNKKLLSVKDRIILTLVKIKQNMCFTALGVLFGINRQTCSNYFRNMCPILSKVLKVVIPWPDQSSIRCNLPLSFKQFKNTRIILDCCEVTIEKCKCLKCRILTYSQYKKNHTVKFNMGVAPSGLITECSAPFGGRASDKLIVNESGILDKLDYADGVMVDKGYRIEKECLERNLKLLRPPFLSQDKQLSRDDALHCAEIARARVHVESVFQRMRQYQFLCGPVPWALAGYFEDVLTIAMGLTNLGPPIINIDKFM